MGKKFEKLQARAIEIIHHYPEYDQEHEYMMILNPEKFKADPLIFKCFQGTNIPNFACYSETFNQKCGTRCSKTALGIPGVRIEAAKISWFQGPA